MMRARHSRGPCSRGTKGAMRSPPRDARCLEVSAAWLGASVAEQKHLTLWGPVRTQQDDDPKAPLKTEGSITSQIADRPRASVTRLSAFSVCAYPSVDLLIARGCRARAHQRTRVQPSWHSTAACRAQRTNLSRGLSRRLRAC